MARSDLPLDCDNNDDDDVSASAASTESAASPDGQPDGDCTDAGRNSPLTLGPTLQVEFQQQNDNDHDESFLHNGNHSNMSINNHSSSTPTETGTTTSPTVVAEMEDEGEATAEAASKTAPSGPASDTTTGVDGDDLMLDVAAIEDDNDNDNDKLKPGRRRTTVEEDDDLLIAISQSMDEMKASTDPRYKEQLEFIKTNPPRTQLEQTLSEVLERKDRHITKLVNELNKLKEFITKRKTSYKRKRKNDGAPTRALSAYNIFMQDRFAALSKQNEQALLSSNTDAKLTRIPPEKLVAASGNLWRTLPIEEKQKYEQRAKADRERYDREMAEFEGKMNRSGGHSDGRDGQGGGNDTTIKERFKRSKTGYNIFFSAHVARLKEKQQSNGGGTGNDSSSSSPTLARGSIAKLVGNAWKSLTEEQRQYYEREADKFNGLNPAPPTNDGVPVVAAYVDGVNGDGSGDNSVHPGNQMVAGAGGGRASAYPGTVGAADSGSVQAQSSLETPQTIILPPPPVHQQPVDMSSSVEGGSSYPQPHSIHTPPPIQRAFPPHHHHATHEQYHGYPPARPPPHGMLYYYHPPHLHHPHASPAYYGGYSSYQYQQQQQLPRGRSRRDSEVGGRDGNIGTEVDVGLDPAAQLDQD